MKKSLLPLPAMALTLTLGACANSDTAIYSPHSPEAVSVVDGGNFGVATMNNAQIMSGERSYVLDLSNRFASEVLTTVTFAFDSDVLDGIARNTLDQQATWIRQFPEVRFKVYGHADAVGSPSYNKNLGLRRARAVVAFLSTRGVSRSRLEAVVSYGETQPLIVTQGRERRNRRTVTEVSGFVRSHPIIMEGKYAQVVYRGTIASAKPASDLAMAGSIGDVGD